MSFGTVSFGAWTASAPGIASGLTIAQKAAATPRPGVLGIQFSGSTVTNLTADTSAGFTMAELDLGWDSASTGDNTFSSGYLSDAATMVGDLQSHGYQVAVSAGIFYFPSWLSGYANWQYLDQGSNGSGSPNFVFNPTVRAKAAAYISALQAAMAAAGVVPDYYRVGIGTAGETYLPGTTPSSPNPGQLPIDTGTGSWWAFDALAQASGGTGLPSGVGACPLIGWTPGNSSYPGGSVNSTMATAWWDWYMGAVNNAHQWEIAAHRATGWDGCIMLVTPGRGLCPSILTSRLANKLGPSTISGTSGDFTANIAADWPSMLSTVATPANTVLDISSVGNNDDSTGGNDVTGPGDQSLTLAAADPAVTGWSSTRWLAYLAAQNGNIPCCGESPGDGGSRTWGLASQVSATMTQAKGCGLYAVMWANDASMNLDFPYTNPVGQAPYASPTQVVNGFNAAY